MWPSEWLHMLISIINHRGQRCLMIEVGGTSQRVDVTEMNINIWKNISRFLRFI